MHIKSKIKQASASVNESQQFSESWLYPPNNHGRYFQIRRRDFNQQLLNRLAKQDGQNNLFLDMGCSNGAYLFFAKGCYKRCVGLDISQFLLEDAATRFRDGDAVKFVQASGDNLPFVSGTFNVVLCSETLEHILDVDRAIEEIHRILKPGGLAILDTDVTNNLHHLIFDSIGKHRKKTRHLIPPDNLDEGQKEGTLPWDGHVWNFAPTNFQDRIKKAKFNIISVNYLPFVFYGIHWVLKYNLGFELLILIDKITNKIPILNRYGEYIIIIARKE